jgi:hypothetical protein
MSFAFLDNPAQIAATGIPLRMILSQRLEEMLAKPFTPDLERKFRKIFLHAKAMGVEFTPGQLRMFLTRNRSLRLEEETPAHMALTRRLETALEIASRKSPEVLVLKDQSPTDPKIIAAAWRIVSAAQTRTRLQERHAARRQMAVKKAYLAFHSAL